ncbi:hypothetical protein DXX93_01930 [Thalassotalea euphylliae]|uniref:Spermidine synthase n=1 Tax=Thalassotalea euphylliae TaxID=1655234 RepID=A0A3E0TLJ3_9GAMM|nr:fused MFS/spermidine synthase [Thalassotalea euphylliae]REL25429.1 hypothetical protein DXX93_01930 [Thalassotalea euphylliae]
MLFLLTVFLSAFLLFQVQPFIAKVILPAYGGSATVWTSCMLFFQLLLLAGYSYAHVLQRLSFKRQWQVHAVVLLLAGLSLPFTTPAASLEFASSMPITNILATLAVAIGLPYFALSATGPLVQKWLTISDETKVPYRLYSLSNLGSLLALLSYPFVFEPLFNLQQQTLVWSSGFIAFALAIMALAYQLEKAGVGKPVIINNDALNNAISDENNTASSSHQSSKRSANPVANLTISLWLGLSALGVMLLVSTTNAMTQNVAPMPFLWVLPLALYLLTFIVAFHSPRLYVRWYWLAFYLICALMAIMLPVVSAQFDFISQVLMFSFILFAGCMICHGELIKQAPKAEQLTLFYLMIALGGVLGSALVSLVAPQVFNQFSEYPMTVIAIVMAFTVSLAVASHGQLTFKTLFGSVPRTLSLGSLGIVVIGLSVLQISLNEQLAKHQIASERNFYGLLSVVETSVNGQAERRLIDGTTSHGTQALAPALAHIPKSYYRQGTGVALALDNYMPLKRAIAPIKVGLIGLGAGTLAAYGNTGEQYHFYELNPAVVDYAQQYFSYLRNSKADIYLHQGDGRFLLQQALAENGSEAFDILVLDAFSGDAIPAHLLTVEAMQLYQAHLKENGILAIHISNSHLELSALTQNLADAIKMQAKYFYTASTEHEPNAAQWVLISNNEAIFKRYQVKKHMSSWPSERSAVLWRDDYSNLLSVLK